MKPSGHPCIRTFSYNENLLDKLAAQIIHEQQDRLPDFTCITVLLPELQAAPRLRKSLLFHAQKLGANALLGPEINTFSSWVKRQPNYELPVLSEHQRELMLVEALSKHPYLYGEGNPWMLADSLLELFDELNEINFKLPDELDELLFQIGNAYGLKDTDNESLVGEARLVHTLWHAWHQQMQDEGVIDRHTDQLMKLTASHQGMTPEQTFYIAGFSRFSLPQSHWLKALTDRDQARIFLYGENLPAAICGYHWETTSNKLIKSLDEQVAFPEPRDDYARFITRAYDTETAPLRDRAKQAALDFPISPLTSRLKIFQAASAEQEAQAIDLQTRLWWLEGKRNIGIVTENRRLARRVRALLERAGIQLQDAAGWALSTTSAAATLERWLETVEEDFAYQPLLDLLKSPFLLPDHDREALLATVYRFEQGIVLKENIPRDLSRYRQHTRYRQKRLPVELAAEYEDIYTLLDLLAEACAPLTEFIFAGKHSPGKMLQGLHDSLCTLGLSKSLQNDVAGQRILEELQQMTAATVGTSLRMSWNEFRTWLGRTLERFNFQPQTQSEQVQLMSLTQSSLNQFDALIIAGAEQEYLPGSSGNSPFFNDGVRQALGLASRADLLAEKFYQFRQLLDSAPKVLITHRSEQDGEDILPSPWLIRLQSFHYIAYQDDLLDRWLGQLLGHSDTQVTERSSRLPEPVPANPKVSIDADLSPGNLSASAYQQLVDCPYQFFASRYLKLSPPESIREMLEKSDYGERVHLCLQAFHSKVPSLPGPFTETLTENNLAEAKSLLQEIGKAVFAKDLEDNFLHRGWLKRWQDTIPRYIEWQLQRQAQWQVKTTEAHLTTPLPDTTVILRGRLDRIDFNASGLGIIDYKTGKISAHIDTDIMSGEAVQLPFYAFLAEQALGKNIASVEYLPLEDASLKERGSLSIDDLKQITRQNTERLQELIHAMQNGASLTAWGDETSCSYCQFSGICRRETWQGETGNQA